jgi:hypothetical protein
MSWRSDQMTQIITDSHRFFICANPSNLRHPSASFFSFFSLFIHFVAKSLQNFSPQPLFSPQKTPDTIAN